MKRFALCFTCFSLSLYGSLVLAQPANDTCPGLSITSLPYSHSGNTSTATDDFTPTCASAGGLDVIYVLTPTCSTSVTVALCTSVYNTALAVRSGGVCPGSVQIACNDNFCGIQSSVTFNASQGVTYYLIVDGSSAADFGAYTLSVTGINRAPSNDNCPGRLISLIPYSDNGSTLCATNSYSICASATKKDVYYRYTSNSTRMLTVSLCGSNYDTYLEIRKEGVCPGNLAVGCNDNSTSCSPQSEYVFQADSGTTYYITLSGNNGTAAGLYHFSLTEVISTPPNPVDDLIIVSFPATDNVSLYWNPITAADEYYIYRDTTEAVTIDPAHLIATVSDTFYVDSGVMSIPPSKRMYAVTAVNNP